MMNPKDTVLVPCGHKCLCYTCYEELENHSNNKYGGGNGRGFPGRRNREDRYMPPPDTFGASSDMYSDLMRTDVERRQLERRERGRTSEAARIAALARSNDALDGLSSTTTRPLGGGIRIGPTHTPAPHTPIPGSVATLTPHLASMSDPVNHPVFGASSTATTTGTTIPAATIGNINSGARTTASSNSSALLADAANGMSRGASLTQRLLALRERVRSPQPITDPSNAVSSLAGHNPPPPVYFPPPIPFYQPDDQFGVFEYNPPEFDDDSFIPRRPPFRRSRGSSSQGCTSCPICRKTVERAVKIFA